MRFMEIPRMAKKKSAKLTKKKLEKMRAAAVTAVVLDISASRAASVPDMSRRSGREGWKMAGRAERMGVGAFKV